MAGPRVWLWANTLNWPQGGGHLWVYLNWALGMRACGAQVTWLEAVDPDTPPARTAALVASLKSRLARYGFDDAVAIWPGGAGAGEGTVPLDAADGADLLLNFSYHLGGDVRPRFRRTTLLDIDPGLLQVWLSEGQVQVAPHDLYFTIGETVGAANSK